MSDGWDAAAVVAEVRALVAAGAEDAAARLAAEAAARDDAPPSLLWLAGKLAAENDPERATAWLERAVVLAPAARVVLVDYVETVSNLAEALARAGRHREAEAALRRAAALVGPEPPLLEPLAVFALQGLRPQDARAAVAMTDAPMPFVRALLAIHEGDWSLARSLCPALLDMPDLPPAAPEPPSPPPRYLGRSSVHASAEAGPVALATSLSPRGGAAQRRAISSWSGFGATLISVNTAEEIAQLAPDYPEVEFREATRDGRDLIGKPLVYIDDLLAALASTDAPSCGILNADILLLDGAQLARDIAASGGALTICHRLNIESADDRDGAVYLPGFDAFFFPRAEIARLKGSRMLLGAPWWDYLFAALATISGLPLRIPERTAIGHVVHRVNWSPRMYVVAAALWLEALRAAAAAAPQPLPPPARFLAPLLEAYARHHRLVGEIDDATVGDERLSQSLAMLLTLVNHVVRTQATP